jgi:hypothetical protein
VMTGSPRNKVHRRVCGAVVSVLVAALCAPAAGTAGTGYRFVEKPIVPLEHDSTGAPAFDVYLKLNRQLPRARDGSPKAYMTIADVGGDQTAVTLGRRSSACYASGVDAGGTKSKVLRHPKLGATVRVRLWVEDQVAASTIVHLTRRLKPRGEDQDAPYAKALGC